MASSCCGSSRGVGGRATDAPGGEGRLRMGRGQGLYVTGIVSVWDELKEDWVCDEGKYVRWNEKQRDEGRGAAVDVKGRRRLGECVLANEIVHDGQI